ncbi:hypothetical protein R1sor_023796 [Riccia sorocarpa]|uniref:Endonuclease/exonuclease/phosphatase domain-containing protein n=1 Tax=Riccia sorocarpa TaxID=122646 RepID=A0ABD3GRW4_9MARC
MCQEADMSMVSWNLNGLGSNDKVRAVQDWLNSVGRHAKIIAIQELKAGERVIRIGIRGNGSKAWAKFQLIGEEVGVASIYGPHDLEGKLQLMDWIRESELADGGKWLIGGGLEYGSLRGGFGRTYSASKRRGSGQLKTHGPTPRSGGPVPSSHN